MTAAIESSINTRPATIPWSNCQLLPSVSLISLSEALGNRPETSQAQAHQRLPATATGQTTLTKTQKGKRNYSPALLPPILLSEFRVPHFRLNSPLNLISQPINSHTPTLATQLHPSTPSSPQPSTKSNIHSTNNFRRSAPAAGALQKTSISTRQLRPKVDTFPKTKKVERTGPLVLRFFGSWFFPLGQHSPQRPRAVRELLYRCSKCVQHAQIKIGQRRVLFIDQMLPASDPPAAATADDDGQIVGAVGVAVAQARAEQDHRVVEYRAIAFFHPAQLVQKIGVLLDVPFVDQVIHLELLELLLVMRDVVMAAGHAFEEREIAAANRVAEHERANSRRVRLQGQRHHVQHPPHVVGVAGRV